MMTVFVNIRRDIAVLLVVCSLKRERRAPAQRHMCALRDICFAEAVFDKQIY